MLRKTQKSLHSTALHISPAALQHLNRICILAMETFWMAQLLLTKPPERCLLRNIRSKLMRIMSGHREVILVQEEFWTMEPWIGMAMEFSAQ